MHRQVGRQIHRWKHKKKKRKVYAFRHHSGSLCLEAARDCCLQSNNPQKHTLSMEQSRISSLSCSMAEVITVNSKNVDAHTRLSTRQVVCQVGAEKGTVELS